MRGRRGHWRQWVALSVIYVLVFSALLSGAVPLSHHADPLTDPLGTSICTAEGLHPAPNAPARPQGRDHPLDCCVFGCSMFGSGVAQPPAFAALVPAAPAAAPRLVPLPRVRARASLAWSPRLTRGPPVSA